MEMEMEMEMRASQVIPISLDLTPPLQPLAFSLHSSFLSSHCSSCSLPLPLTPSSPHSNSSLLNYCSPLCSSLDSPFHFSSAQPHLPPFPPSYPLDSSSLRLALRLLQIKAPDIFFKERIFGLMTNYKKFMSADEDDGEIDDEDYGVLRTIKEGAKVLALARRIQDGPGSELDSGLLMEEAMMCLVMTNAVEVQERSGRSIGIAVYDVSFSWINHSCSPNACYRFSTRNDELKGCTLGFQISPAAVENGCKKELLNYVEVAKLKSVPGNGPRIIVRSIKEIKKGEEVTIAYTDLLRPKAIRQAELWTKYCFSCCCKRCSTTPATYVDSVLQGIAEWNLGCPSSTSNQRYCNDETFMNMQDLFDDAIGKYLTFSNPVSCCEKLEKLLTHVYLDDQLELKEQESEPKSRFHLLNHLFLDAYTTLASAYKFRSYEFSALKPVHDAHKVQAFKMSKASAAYSLLLAGMVHHLFLYESCFIVSIVNFWFSAGESLLSLARSSFWEDGFESGLGPSCFSDDTCYQIARVKSLLVYSQNNEEQTLEIKEISRQFVKCAGDAITNTWTFLTCGGDFLDQIMDLDVKCFWTKESISSFQPNGAFNMSEKTTSQVRINIYELGIHCLLYAAFLSCICHGQDSEVVCNVISILVTEGVFTSHPPY